jgi:hypothetical protein
MKLVGGKVVYNEIWPVEYVPIVRVCGDRILKRGWKGFAGIVELVRESQRGLNLACSAERQAQESAPIAPWIMAEGQDEGYEELWDNANTTAYSTLLYKPMSLNGQPMPPPMRVDNTAQTQHILASKAMHTEDMSRQSGIHGNSQGENQLHNESARAFTAKKEANDLGQIHYTGNLEKSIAFSGKVLMQFLLATHDTDRDITLRTQKGETRTVQGNLQELGATSGDFDFEVTSGPLQMSEKQEVVQMIEALGPAIGPEKMSNIAHVLVQNSGLAGSGEVAELLVKMLPPELQPEQEGEDAVPKEAQQALQAQEQTIQQLEGTVQELQGFMDEMAQMITNEDKEREMKITLQEMKDKTSITIAQMNNSAKAETEGTKLGVELARMADEAKAETEQVASEADVTNELPEVPEVPEEPQVPEDDMVEPIDFSGAQGADDAKFDNLLIQ